MDLRPLFGTDLTRQSVALIINSRATTADKMRSLADLEPSVIRAWDAGLTSVKPVHLMTGDDLVQ